MEIIRYQVLIPVTEVQVRASSVKDVDSHYLWELIQLKSQMPNRRGGAGGGGGGGGEKVYHLSNSTSEFRNAFLKTIRQIIRESVRNMNIPPASGPGVMSRLPVGAKPEVPRRSDTTRLQQRGDGDAVGAVGTRTLQINRSKRQQQHSQQVRERAFHAHNEL